jgi:hypothetical protein
MESSNQKVLEALMLAGRVTCTSTIVVITEYNTVAALLDTLDTAEELDMDGHPPADPATVSAAGHVVVTKPKREPKAKRQYTSGPLMEYKACHKQKPAAQMCKTGECKTCRIREKMQEKMLAKLQEPEKSQDKTVKHPQTWTNKRLEFGKEEAISHIRDKSYVQVDLHKLAGRKIG